MFFEYGPKVLAGNQLLAALSAGKVRMLEEQFDILARLKLKKEVAHFSVVNDQFARNKLLTRNLTQPPDLVGTQRQ